MPEGELTDEKLYKACESYRPDIVNFAEPRAVARDAQKKLAVYLYELCSIHQNLQPTLRVECEECEKELRKGVGLT